MKKLLLLYKVTIPFVVYAAIINEFNELPRHALFNVINFFSFFTIESNIFAATILLISGILLLKNKKSSQTFAYVRGAATLFMVVTGIVYTLLLSDTGGHSWMNTVLHYIFPMVMFADWLLDRAPTLRFKKAMWWLAFPIFFLAYSLIRGPIVSWYPYPFLDPRKDGYAHVAITSVVIAVAGIILTLLLTSYTRLGSSAKKSK